MKVGDKLGIGVENINMLADTFLAEGSTVQLYGRLNKETVSFLIASTTKFTSVQCWSVEQA